MRIAIPVDGQNVDTSICISFGRAPFFMFYDGETKQYRFLENTAASSQGGAGIKAAQLLVDNGVNVLVTPRCGQNAADVLTAVGIKLFKSNGKSAEKTVEEYLSGNLESLLEIHAGFHNHGGKK